MTLFVRVFVLAVLLAYALPTAPSSAQAETYPLVTGDDYAPFTGRNLAQKGLASVIVQRAFRRMGHETTIAFKPWKRGFSDVQAGKYLGTFPYGWNAKRDADFYYSKPLYKFGQYMFALRDSDHTFQSMTDLTGKRVCLPLGYNPVRLKPLADAGKITLVQPPDIQGCFRMLELGRADLVRVNDIVGWSVIQRMGDSRIKFRMLPNAVRESVEHFIVPRSNPDGKTLMADFDRALTRMEETGEIYRLIERYLR